ncbi:hypothetical protein BJ166DRAFT_532500 [Pestalotiopsis sp. NC0098]|nr:hypothetical protein BJ166DRAFT_532500 [Pestalotiopsis sp. NC0098]
MLFGLLSASLSAATDGDRAKTLNRVPGPLESSKPNRCLIVYMDISSLHSSENSSMSRPLAAPGVGPFDSATLCTPSMKPGTWKRSCYANSAARGFADHSVKWSRGTQLSYWPRSL